MRKVTLLFVIALLALMTVAPAAAQDDLKFPIGEGPFNWENLAAFEELDFSGQSITVFTPWLGPDAELVESVLAYFEYATGADVVHAGSDSFEQQIVIDIEAGSPPDVAVFPQPGLAADVASKGGLVPLGDELKQFVLDNYAAGQSWVDLGTYAGADGADDFEVAFAAREIEHEGAVDFQAIDGVFAQV